MTDKEKRDRQYAKQVQAVRDQARTVLPAPEQIRAMEPGRELDALVAEICFGWRYCIDINETHNYNCVLFEPERVREFISECILPGPSKPLYRGTLPRYSSDWSAAGPLLESCPSFLAVCVDGSDSSVEITLSGADEPIVVEFDCTKPNDLCRAICVARLLAALATKERS